MSDDSSATAPSRERQCRLMDDFAEPSAEPLTPLERLVARTQIRLPLIRRLGGLYLEGVLFSVLILYGVNYGFFLWLSPWTYGEEIASKLLSLFFNPIFLLADSMIVLFCAWFVRYYSREYVKALRDICYLIDFPEQERDLVPTDRITLARVVLNVLWNPLYSLSRRYRRASTIAVTVIAVSVPLCVVSRFPVSEAYQHIGLYLLMFTIGSWIIAPVTWNAPAEYKGINRNLWTTFKSHQTFLATIFTLSIAVAELTWVTYLPTMERLRFFQKTHFLPSIALRLEVYLEYVFLFAFLASLAHVICSVAVGVFFLWHRRYVIWLDPLDEFGSGGLRPLCMLVEKSTYAIALVVGIMFGSRFVVYPIQELRNPYYVQIATGATFLILFSYVLPILVLHSQVQRFKLDWTRKLGPHKIAILREKLATIDMTTVELLGSNWAAGYARIQDISDWPNLSVIVRVLLASLTPVISYFARLYLHLGV